MSKHSGLQKDLRNKPQLDMYLAVSIHSTRLASFCAYTLLNLIISPFPQKRMLYLCSPLPSGT